MGFGVGHGGRIFDPVNGSVERVALRKSPGCADVSRERHPGDVAGGRSADWLAPTLGGSRSFALVGRVAGIAGKLKTFSGADGANREACLAPAARGRRRARNQ